MELGEYLGILRKRWIVIAVLTVLGGALGYAATATDVPQYRSTATVYLTTSRGDTISELNQGASYTSTLMGTYALLVTTPVVLDPVISQLDLGVSATTLARSLTTDIPLNSYLIDISASSASPARAADIANAVAHQLGIAVDSLSPTATDGTAALKMTQVSPAVVASAPFSPRPRLTAAAGLAVGLVLGVAFALLRAQLDTRVRSSKDLPHPPTRTALGHIPHDADLSRTSNYLVHSPHTPLAEAYRRLRTNLQFLDASRPLRTFVVTSTLPGEGKSTTAVNLALVMAEKGSHVLLVDADLRSPSIADLCGLEGAAGLSAVLIHEAAIEDVAQPWQVAGLDVIAAGQVPPNPSQLVESHAMEEFIGRALELYDLVILDTPPLLAVTDGAVLARRTDGALVVARSRAVKQPDLAESLASLDAVGSHVLGVLVNDVRDNRADRHYGYGTSKPARGHESVRHLRRRPVARVAHVEQGTSLWPAEMPRHSASSAVPARGDAPDGADEQIDHDGPRSVQETGLRTTED